MRRVVAYCTTPTFLRAFHGWCIALWAFIWVVAVPTGWISSVAFVSHVSMATALLTSFAAWGASRVEVKQDEQNGSS